LPIWQISFPFFEVDDKAQPCAGGQRQILLCDAQSLPVFPDDLANCLCRILRRSRAYYHTGMLIFGFANVMGFIPGR
jgi:hypothetical protein